MNLTLGEYLRNIRGDKTLGQIAAISGINKGYLSKIENGERNPKPEKLEELSHAYTADYDILMEICGYKKKDPLIIRRLRNVSDKLDDETQEKMLKLISDNFESLFDDEN